MPLALARKIQTQNPNDSKNITFLILVLVLGKLKCELLETDLDDWSMIE